MNSNYINYLKYAAFASRLGNFQNLFARDAANLYKAFDLEFEPRWFTLIKLLLDKGPMGVTEIANLLNQTHPAVNQVGNALESKNIIQSNKDKNDSRKRILVWTDTAGKWQKR